MISKTKLDRKISTSTIYYWINKGFFGLKRNVLNYARKRKKKDKTKNQILLKNYLLENQDDKKKKSRDIAEALNISETTVKRYYEKTEKEIFLEQHDKSFFLYRYSEELKKEEFFIFKALINNPNLNKNQISQITGISYSTIYKYYPKIENIMKEWEIYNTFPMSANRKEKEIV